MGFDHADDFHTPDSAEEAPVVDRRPIDRETAVTTAARDPRARFQTKY